MKKTDPAPKTTKGATKHRKLKALKCFAQMRVKLMEGESCAEVAEWIQGTAKELVDMKRPALEAALYSFRADIPPGEIKAHLKPPTLVQAEDAIDKGRWAVNEMDSLFVLQRGRLKMALDAEKQAGELNPELKHEFKVASGLLLEAMEMREKLGLLPPRKDAPAAPAQVTNIQVNTSAAAAIADQHGDKADSIKLVMSDPKKAQNVRAVYEMLVAVDAAKAAKPAADGS